jgi:AraC family transcriptional regulator of adaptative response/methylated-DNA-[protein]-cysteine methyltransferase
MGNVMTAERPFATRAARLAAIARRDPAADGHFYYAVKTTGVYCRPSGAARPARAENVEFHTTAAAAERAGFRACKRCRPEAPPRAEREARLVADACRAIEAADEELFKRVSGVTPKAYATAQRQRRVEHSLKRAAGVTEAIYAAGYNSSSRFYEKAPGMLGMTPSAYREGGAGEVVHHATARCALGVVLVAATARGICAILLGDDAAALATELQARFPKATLTVPRADFGQVVAEVVRLVDDPAHGRLTLPLDIRGTAFQRRVWEQLRQIPAGETRSYAEVAARLGRPRGARAVAAACAANTLAVAVPCHRVNGSDGELHGYRWGVERKRRLLIKERQ